jgi:hypothetical protein
VHHLDAAAPEPHINATLEHASQLRELRALDDVSQVELPRDRLIAKLRAHVERTVPRVEIESEQLFLHTIGVLGASESYEDAVYAALRDAVAGMYEPFDKKMYVPNDLPADVLGASVLHESVHALQDQHFDLGAFEKWLPGQGDTMSARSCLAEGDATSAATDGEGQAHDASLDQAGETYVAREMVAPYVFGTAFVRALRKRGGWAEVNRAWTRTGLTTEQIIHPDKWFADEGALAVPIPTMTALGASGVRVSTDVRGELGLRLVLASAMPGLAAAQAAEGWGGDALFIGRVGDAPAIAWRLRFDDDAHTQRAFAAMTLALGPRACSLVQKQRDVLAVFAPEAVCKRWSEEVFSAW